MFSSTCTQFSTKQFAAFAFASLLCTFVDHLYYFCLFCYAFVRVCLLMPCGHLLGKDWPLGSRLWCLIVKLSLSHWYPVSGMVLDFIDFWYLSPFLLWYTATFTNCNIASGTGYMVVITGESLQFTLSIHTLMVMVYSDFQMSLY